MRRPRGTGGAVCVWAAWLLVSAAAVHPGGAPRFVAFDEVRALLADAGLQAPVPAGGEGAEARWNDWIASRDRQIRARLVEGDEDTLLNWLLLGTSFTSEPPLVLDAGTAATDAGMRQMAGRLAARVSALLDALAAPDTDERGLFGRDVLLRHGVDVAAGGRDAAREFLLGRLGPFLDEWMAIGRRTDHVFRDRGVSLDTSLQPNFAVDQSLQALTQQGVLRPGSVRRVAVIGAGLDFADKNSGFDFYPTQTVQPFAVLDSLRRLGLADEAAEVVAFDISPRVLDHISRLRANAKTGRGIVLHLPLDTSRPWTPAFADYWREAGAHIGTPARSVPVPAQTTATIRGLEVPAAVVERLSESDTNIVTERYAGGPFDLVVATNVLIYYDPFEQALALANVADMLGPGGVFLSNTPMPVPAGAPLRRIGGLTTTYTVEGAGDEIAWYSGNLLR